MCRRVSRIEKKRYSFRRLLYVSHRVITNGVGIVEVFILFPFIFSRLAVSAQGQWSEKAAASLGSPEEIIKTTFERSLSVEYGLIHIVPFAYTAASIAGL